MNAEIVIVTKLLVLQFLFPRMSLKRSNWQLKCTIGKVICTVSQVFF